MVYEQTVSSAGTELDFLNAVYDWFLAIDGVVMNPTKDNLEVTFNTVLETSDYFTFTMTFRNVVFCFRRENIGKNNKNYRYGVSVNGTSYSETLISVSSSSQYYNIHTDRQIKLKLINYSAGFKWGIGNYNATTLAVQRIFILANSSILYSTSQPSSGRLSENTFETMNGSTSYQFAQMLSYVAGEDSIDYFRFSVLCDSSLQKVAILDNLNHCSTVPLDQILVVDGKNYYSIATDCIVEV